MKEEKFLQLLEETLNEELPSQEVRQHMMYYRDYIAASRSVKTDSQIMQELGDPRLIARTIIDQYKLTHKTNNAKAGSRTYQTNDSGYSYGEGEDKREEKSGKSSLKMFRTASWITTLIAFLILFLFFGIVLWIGGVMIKLFFRFILPIILIFIGVNWIRKQFRR